MSPRPASLRWAVKESFVRYVRVLAAGTCEASDGALLGGDDVAEFPLLSATRGPGRWDLSFGGTVRFLAHHGALDVTLTGLRIVLGAGGGELSVAAGERRITIADLPAAEPDTDGGSLRWRWPAPILTEAGVPFFGTVYAAGTGLAPLDVDVPLD